MNAPTPAPTITPDRVVVQLCPHCAVVTVQVAGGRGFHVEAAGSGNEIRIGGGDHACLQCIADGGTCCSLAPLTRWSSS